MEERNFMLTTTSAYNFWLYELCDVYIVSSPTFAYDPNEIYNASPGSDETHDRRVGPS